MGNVPGFKELNMAKFLLEPLSRRACGGVPRASGLRTVYADIFIDARAILITAVSQEIQY